MNWRHRFINPVLEKEIRLRMRTFRSPLAIMLYLVTIGLLALGFMFMMMNGFNGTRVLNPENSRALFYFLCGAQLVLISFVVPGLTAGVISGEREKQTLNMLLTTQQSSTTIIVSKLIASVSFMMLIIIATLPIYSIVFLYGGISPSQLISVFLYYIFVMIVFGSFGVLFSTLFKKTVISIITTYGVMLFFYGFTGIAAIFLAEILRSSNSLVPGFILSLNPMAALISIFEPGFSEDVFNRQIPWLQLWHVFIPVFTVLSAGAILLSIRYLRPVLRKSKV